MAGIRTTLIERNPGTLDEPRAVSIDDESLRSMQTLGLVDRVVERTLPGYGSRYYSPGHREFARVKPKTVEFGHPRRSGFHQPDLEATLLDGLKRFPNVKVWFEHEFEKYEQDVKGVTVTVRDPDGVAKRVRGAFLAGCDGGRSSIRSAIGAALVGSSFEERWLVFDTVNDFDDTPDSVAHCDHRRPAITLPGIGKTRRWEFVVRPGENADEFLKPETITRLLHPYIGARPVEVVRKVVYPSPHVPVGGVPDLPEGHHDRIGSANEHGGLRGSRIGHQKDAAKDQHRLARVIDAHKVLKHAIGLAAALSPFRGIHDAPRLGAAGH